MNAIQFQSKKYCHKIRADANGAIIILLSNKTQVVYRWLPVLVSFAAGTIPEYYSCM